MVPLSKLHKHIAVPIWHLSIFVFFMGAIFFTQKILAADIQKKSLSKTFYFLAILLTLRFLLSVVQRVQSDCLVLFLLALFIFALFQKREMLAGFSLASASIVKLTPLIFLPYLFFRKKIKAMFACGLWLVVYLLVPALYVGWDRNIQYLKGWFLVHQKNPAEYLFWYKNQSLLSCLLRLLSKDSAVGILDLKGAQVYVIFLILVAVLFSLIFILRKKESPFSGIKFLSEISLVIILMVLSSPLAWKHTFVHLVIAYMVGLYYSMYIQPQDKINLSLLIASFIIMTILNPELTKPFAQLIQQYSNVTWGTLFLYVALLRINAKL